MVAIPRPEVIRALSFGFDAFLADLYWIGGVHYFGEPRNQGVCYGALSNYLEVTAALAPRFKSVYKFGGIAIPCSTGNGWVNIEAASRLLEKGLQQFPDEWFLRLLLAYNFSAFLGRYQDAANQLFEAAKVPGSPNYLTLLATRLSSVAGNFEAARVMALQVARDTDDPLLQEAMQQRVIQIDTEEAIKRIEAAVASYLSATGRLPASLSDVVTAGTLGVLPAEPSGGKWLYDAGTGAVSSSVQVERLKLHLPKQPTALAPEAPHL